MKCSVIGNGPLGVSVAVQLFDCNCDVTYIDCSKDKSVFGKYSKNGFIPVLDSESYNARIRIEESFDSIKECELLVIGTTSSCYSSLFKTIKEMINDEMHILFMPACYGAIILKQELKRIGVNPIISEATSYPLVCSFNDAGLLIQSKKKTLGLSVCPTSLVEQEVSFYNKFFKIFEPAKNFLFTSLDNMNLTLHPLPVLLNLVSTDPVKAGFRHYLDGFTPSVGKLVELIDAERIKIGKAFGFTLTSSIQQLKNYYGNSETNSIREYVINPNGPYPKVGGFGPCSRYVDEDVPGLLVPASELAKIAGLDVPVIDLCIKLANLVNNKEYKELGFNISKLGFKGLSVSEIINTVER